MTVDLVRTTAHQHTDSGPPVTRTWRGGVGPVAAWVGTLAVVGFVMYPVAMSLIGSVLTDAPGARDQEFSLRAWADAYTDPRTYDTWRTSLILMAVVTGVSTLIGTSVAWLCARTDLPGVRIIKVLMLLPLFMPGILVAMGVTLLGSVGPVADHFDPYSLEGVILALTINVAPLALALLGLRNLRHCDEFWKARRWTSRRICAAPPGTTTSRRQRSASGRPSARRAKPTERFTRAALGRGPGGGPALPPLMFLLVLPTLENMDARLEEAALVSGASRATILRRITMPLSAPALLAAAVLTGVRILETLDIPVLLGRGAGVDVFSSRVYLSIYGTPNPNYALASTLAFSLLVFAGVLVVWQARIIRRGQFESVSGKGLSTEKIRLRGHRYPVVGVLVVYLSLGTIVPVLATVTGSFQRAFGLFDRDNYTTVHWSRVLAEQSFENALKNSVILASATAIIMLVAGFVLAYVIVRRPGRRSWVLELASWAPWAIPGVSLGLGLLWGYTIIDVPIYGTLWILLIAYVTTFLPLTVRQWSSAITQISFELEESAMVAGVGRLRTALQVVLPIAFPSAVFAGLLAFVLAIREVSASALLSSYGTEVLGAKALQEWSGGAAGGAAVYGVFMLGLSAIAFAVLGLFARISTSRHG